MIATDSFVYVHLHKSGGSFVNECIMRFFPEARVLGYHLPRSRIPQALAALPVLGFVRSPWSYYVSWYSFQAQMAQPNALFLVASKQCSLDFRGTVRRLLTLGDDGGMLDELLPRLPGSYGNRGLNLPAFALEPIRRSGQGLYSFLYDYMYAGGDGPCSIGRVENLRADLLTFLGATKAGLTPALREFIEQTGPRNASRHGDYRDYYDAELAAQVAERDQRIIERHGYRFDD